MNPLIFYYTASNYTTELFNCGSKSRYCVLATKQAAAENQKCANEQKPMINFPTDRDKNVSRLNGTSDEIFCSF